MPNFNENGFGSGRFGVSESAPGPVYTLGVDYYVDLYTSQYKLAEKFMAYSAALLYQKMDDVGNAMALFEEDFDPDIAIGAQLDTVGLIAGISRTVPFQPSAGVSPVLDDATYRTVIKAQIAKNAWNGLASSLPDIWTSLFPGGTITLVDEQNMTATLILSGIISSIMRDLIVRDFIVPRPEGVLYNYTFTTTPIFGFSDAPGGPIQGFDAGFWS